jgi:hypothetical protein
MTVKIYIFSGSIFPTLDVVVSLDNGCRWVDNIKIDLRETEWDGMDWIYLAQDGDQWRALLNPVINLRVP